MLGDGQGVLEYGRYERWHDVDPEAADDLLRWVAGQVRAAVHPPQQSIFAIERVELDEGRMTVEGVEYVHDWRLRPTHVPFRVEDIPLRELPPAWPWTVT